jgi:hypothetical protein
VRQYPISSPAVGTTAPDSIKRLVDHFDRNRKVFQSADYKEEQLSAEFDLRPSIRHSSFVIRTLPHGFSVLPADILGQVYEQFLGKVIRLTAGHQAKVEEKPEVRKAGQAQCHAESFEWSRSCQRTSTLDAVCEYGKVLDSERAAA